jgi:hypothetical protein
MDELVPIILAAILGALIWRVRSNRTRTMLGALVVLVVGPAATVLSGEYVTSWIYLLLDLGEAAFGLALGMALAAWLHHARMPRRKPASPS